MKKIFINLGLGGVALFIALVCGELVAQVYLKYQNRAMRERNLGNILTRPPMFEDLFAPIDPGGFTNRANFESTWWGTSVRTDSLGCRIGPAAPDSARRILFIGDSMIFGTGLEDSMTVPALLQKAINGRFPNRPAFVINAGVPGYDFQQYNYQTQRLAAALHPQLILVGICNNDIFPTEDPFGNVIADRKGKMIGTASKDLIDNGGGLLRSAAMLRRELLKSSALYTLWQQFRRRLKLMTASREKYDPLMSESGRRAAVTTDQFLDILSNLGIAHGFIYQPVYENLGKESEYVFYRLLKLRGQPVLDLCLEPGLDETTFFAKETASGAVHPQMHFNAKGSQIVADAIADWLETSELWP